MTHPQCSAASEAEKPRPVKLHAWGGQTRINDYLMSDGTVKAMTLDEAKAAGYGAQPQTVSEWRPIATAPEVDITQRDPETVLLWVADGGHGGKGTHAFGRCYKSHDGSIRAVASGFHGNWNITHWSPLSRPQRGD
jgi:hypothetical protein